MSKFLASKSDKHLHKWGFKDSGFKSIGDKVVKFSGDRYEVSGTEMPDFIPYIEKMLNIEIEDNDKLKEVDEKFVSPSKVDKKFYQELEKVFESDKFTIENTERLIHSHGQETFKDIYKVCLLYTSPSPRDGSISRMPSSA